MTGKTRKSPRAVMNGAAARLLRLRVRTESDMRMVSEVTSGLDAAQHALAALKHAGADMQASALEQAIKTLKAIQGDLDQSAREIRGAEQLAGPESWRLQAEYDEPFAVEFLNNLDPVMLRLALSRLNEEQRAVILATVCDEAG